MNVKNPKHPLMQALSNNMETILCMIVSKYANGEVILTEKDIEAEGDKLLDKVLAVKEDSEGLKLFFITEKESDDILKRQDGPTH